MSPTEGEGEELVQTVTELVEQDSVPRDQVVWENEPPLTSRELHELREVLRDRDRVRWMWKAAKTWALWIVAIVAGINYGWEALGRIVKALSE